MSETTDPSDQPKPTVAQVFGEITWVLSQSRYHKHFSLGDLEWLVMPAILATQFRVFHAGVAPVGFGIWAYLSPEIEARVQAQVESGVGARLRPEDWKSGDRLWLIELVVLDHPDRDNVTTAMLTDLAKNVFPGQRLKLFAADPLTGRREVKEIGA
ncbi:MAG: toxin-activating lysine-acyltransferase [Terricaulis sp.]